jgi:hypothetical protein
MELLEKIRRYESMHIVFWLIKDSCWMLELRWIGCFMIIPTVGLAFYLILKTFGSRDFYLNMAIFFWITANSYWMVVELFFDDLHRNYATIPFALGFIFVGLFYFKTAVKEKNEKVPKSSANET